MGKLGIGVEWESEGGGAPVNAVAMHSFKALGCDNYLELAAVHEANPAAFEDTYINCSLPLKQYIERLDGGVFPPVDVAQS